MNATKIKIYGREKGGGFFKDYICSFLRSKYLFDIQVDNRTLFFLNNSRQQNYLEDKNDKRK